MKKQLLQLSIALGLGLPMASIAQNTFPTNGYVGIGTINPLVPLHVANGSAIFQWAAETGSDHGLGLFRSRGTLASPQILQQGDAVGSVSFRAYDGSGFRETAMMLAIVESSPVVGNAAPTALTFRTGNERMRIASNGNIGIGTASPQYKLDVVGNTKISGDLLLGDSSLSARAISANSRLDISSAEYIFLNRLNSSGTEVFVGSGEHQANLTVSGKVSTQTLALTSDRNRKMNFLGVSPASVLAKVAALPVTTWAYTNSPAIRHLGPMAQDFKATFPDIGEDDKHIGAGDGIGVALAAIKGLHELVQEKDSEIAALKKELSAFKQDFAARFEKMEKLVTQAGNGPGVPPTAGFTLVQPERSEDSSAPANVGTTNAGVR